MTDNANPKVLALASHLGVEPDTITSENTEGTTEGTRFECTEEPGEYLVLDEGEADTLYNEELDNYIDEHILPRLPKELQGYFDSASWKRDAEISDGRGHTLATYDGAEEEEKINDVWYFIYRIN